MKIVPKVTVDDQLEAATQRIEELEDTLRDIKAECRKATESNWKERVEGVYYLASVALVEAG